MFALTGCGFTPLYGGAKGQAASASLEMVQVQNIPDRTGQMLRQSLQQKFYTNGAPTRELYTLSVNYSISQTGEGVQADSSTSRTRFNATAAWRLAPIGQPSQTLVSGNATAMDALNIIDQQYFATNLETDTVNQQLADEISSQITTELAAWFHAHPGS
ncbi:LPS assembly lipoprotein LptE [Acidocella sp.]|uniref:LPS assembly lipoprotein LptE n=1 Tax=Acidocella sp. TaxID=50710 RepID=UPI003CFC8E01